MKKTLTGHFGKGEELKFEEKFFFSLLGYPDEEYPK